MNEIEFRAWLIQQDYNKKVISDAISRIKKIEKELGCCDIDELYSNDNCKHLLSVLSNMGNNQDMKKFLPNNLPIGNYQMNTYKYAINLYIKYCNNKSKS